jgi:cell division septum initiation protein DivIVA
MTNGGERLERIEHILEQVANGQQQVVNSLQEMAARQQYHDEAFERHDTEMKLIREAIAADAENIRALVRIAELHHRRLEGLEGGEPA